MLQIDVEKLPTYRLGFKRGFALAKEEAAREYLIGVARKMLRKGGAYDVESVAWFTDLPVEEVEKINAEINSENSNLVPTVSVGMQHGTLLRPVTAEHSDEDRHANNHRGRG